MAFVRLVRHCLRRAAAVKQKKYFFDTNRRKLSRRFTTFVPDKSNFMDSHEVPNVSQKQPQSDLALENAALKEKIRVLNHRLQRAEESAPLGESASEIAHDIRNISNFGAMAFALLKRCFTSLETVEAAREEIHKLKTIEEVKEHLSKLVAVEEESGYDTIKEDFQLSISTIDSAFERLDKLADNFKKFYQHQQNISVKYNINEELEKIIAEMESSMSGQIQFVRDFGEIPEIESYRGQLNQAFTNMLKNAVEAILSKRNKNGAQQSIRVTTLIDKDACAFIKIADTGCGMTKETEEKLFDPFYTTKDPDQRIGLGMTVARKLVSKNRGGISVESVPDEGSTLIVKLLTAKRESYS